MSKPTCYSGAAIGSDDEWGQGAGTIGHNVIHFTFANAKNQAAVPAHTLRILTKDELSVADAFLKKANKTLKRSFPSRWEDTNNLLRRNFYQVHKTTAVLAISTIKNGLVQGGTSWAVQMFIDAHDGGPCEAYVFDQDANQWFKWEGRWMKIDEPPIPNGDYTGIGTRDININGKKAIYYFLKKFREHHTVSEKVEEIPNVQD